MTLRLFVCFVYTVCIIYSSSHFQFCVMSWFCHCTIFTHNLLPYIVNLQSLESLEAHEIYCKMSLIWLAKKKKFFLPLHCYTIFLINMVLQTVGIIMLYRPTSGIGIVSGLWLRGIIISPIWSLESVNLAECTCSWVVKHHHGFLLTSLKLYSGRLFKLAIYHSVSVATVSVVVLFLFSVQHELNSVTNKDNHGYSGGLNTSHCACDNYPSVLWCR